MVDSCREAGGKTKQTPSIYITSVLNYIVPTIASLSQPCLKHLNPDMAIKWAFKNSNLIMSYHCCKYTSWLLIAFRIQTKILCVAYNICKILPSDPLVAALTSYLCVLQRHWPSFSASYIPCPHIPYGLWRCHLTPGMFPHFSPPLLHSSHQLNSLPFAPQFDQVSTRSMSLFPIHVVWLSD
jgi:hypothetical protein